MLPSRGLLYLGTRFSFFKNAEKLLKIDQLWQSLDDVQSSPNKNKTPTPRKQRIQVCLQIKVGLGKGKPVVNTFHWDLTIGPNWVVSNIVRDAQEKGSGFGLTNRDYLIYVSRLPIPSSSVGRAGGC